MGPPTHPDDVLPIQCKRREIVMKIRGLFLVLAIAFLVQSAHFSEHIAQVYQIYAQGIRPPDAHGLLGSLFDFEWVHFVYNIGLEIALIGLWLGYRSLTREYRLPAVSAALPFLKGLVLFQGYHSIEHITKLYQYLFVSAYQSGTVPTPGIAPTLTGWPIFLVHFGINLIVWVLMTLVVWRLHNTYWKPARVAMLS
jgi:hypothetical protein